MVNIRQPSPLRSQAKEPNKEVPRRSQAKEPPPGTPREGGHKPGDQQPRGAGRARPPPRTAVVSAFAKSAADLSALQFLLFPCFLSVSLRLPLFPNRKGNPLLRHFMLVPLPCFGDRIYLHSILWQQRSKQSPSRGRSINLELIRTTALV